MGQFFLVGGEFSPRMLCVSWTQRLDGKQFGGLELASELTKDDIGL